MPMGGLCFRCWFKLRVTGAPKSDCRCLLLLPPTILD